MDFIENFINRGYFHQATDLNSITELMKKQKIAGYVGFDCTASSLHVGSLMQIMIMRLMQQSGHKPIIIIGGGTSKIGDPSGKDEARKMMSAETMAENIEGIKKSLAKFIKFGDGPSDALMINNAKWLDNIGYIDFLSDYGRLFSVNRMLSMDSVKLRLEREQSLSFLEFNYMLLQAYDFLFLNKNYDCRLQFGGSDQWGNIVMGTDLIRRVGKDEAYGLTTPLLTTASGAKMGKSVGGAIWLNEDMLSPFDYFQYWRNCEDLDVIKFAKLYAEYNSEQLEEFSKLAHTDINAAKKQLAYTLTLLCHGKDEADLASESARRVFEEGAMDENLPTFFLDQNIDRALRLFELLVKFDLSPSNSEAKKLIRGGGVKINDNKAMDENFLIDGDLINNDKFIKLSIGKKRHVLIKQKIS